jgi:hypothetical protein
VKVGYLLRDEDALFEEQTVYRKLKLLRTQVMRKIRRGGIYRDQLNLLID